MHLKLLLKEELKKAAKVTDKITSKSATPMQTENITVCSLEIPNEKGI